MNHQYADAQVVPYTKYQRWMAATYRSVQHKPMIHGLLKVDVTKARTTLRAHRAQTGEALSFTAFLATCMARAVDENKAVQAFRQGARHLVLFNDVDISIWIEHDEAGRKYLIPHALRAANRKSVRDLHHEIRTAQARGGRDAVEGFRLLSIPTMFLKPFFWTFIQIARWRPRLWKQTMGTVSISAVGMFGNGAGWGIPIPTSTSLMVTVGGIGERQILVDGHPVVREYLSLTISFDHEVVDGAPAARFARRLKELIESGYGLGDALVAPQVAAAVDASTGLVKAAHIAPE
jgi:pyruvate/2-oxoglutarate dehydrogenase complex dihydrolipoamide acyltransferase (E2) component